MPMSNDKNPLITRAAEEVTSTPAQKIGKTLLTLGIGIGAGGLAYKYGPCLTALSIGLVSSLLGMGALLRARLKGDVDALSKANKKAIGFAAIAFLGIYCANAHIDEYKEYESLWLSSKAGIGHDLSKDIIAGQTEVTRSRTIKMRSIFDWVQHERVLTGSAHVVPVDKEAGIVSVAFKDDVPKALKDVSLYKIQGKRLIPLVTDVR